MLTFVTFVSTTASIAIIITRADRIILIAAIVCDSNVIAIAIINVTIHHRSVTATADIHRAFAGIGNAVNDGHG